nr:hypothetical protein [Tanacetum cinerariifolium]
MILDNDRVSFETTKEKVKSLALKAKVTRDQTSDHSDSQGGSDKDIDEKEAEAFNLLARNFCKDGAEQLNDPTYLMAIESQKACLKCDLLPDNWIMDSGYTKNMTKNRRLFTTYKAYDGGHIVFGSNLKGKVVGGVRFTKVDCDISTNGKLLAKGHRRNGLYACELGDNSRQQICLASVMDNSTLWHKRLGHANM